MRNQGDVVTFYSYKGGTGRSMALVNCAGLIAQHLPDETKPILLIDFDLEAPGLHRYLEPYLAPKDEWAERPGTLELVEKLAAAVESRLASETNTLEDGDPRLDDETTAKIVDDIDLSGFLLNTTMSRLILIKAGCFNEDYDRRVSRFDWEKLFRKAPALFRCMGERFAREYSFAFVDSRTGISDTTGICTMLLPDVAGHGIHAE